MIDRDKTHLERMSDEVEFITKTIDGISKDRFFEDSLLQHGICMSIVTIGECANRLSDEFTEKYPEVPWTKVIAVRNMVAHVYWQLDMELVWRAATMSIPELRVFLSKFV
jgi:uncharacterized protein with HEPN domain